MATPKKGKRTPAAHTAAGDAVPRLRRKNLILDQDRIDRARAALGAATETETITRALDAVLDVDAMRAQIHAVLTELAGQRLDIMNYSDDPEALDYSGFAGWFPDLAGGLSTPEAREAAGFPPYPTVSTTARTSTHKPTRKPARSGR